MQVHHTPGPWTIETRHHVHAICCKPTRNSEHQEVCFVDVTACQFPGAAPDDLSAGSITAQQRPKEELLANAYLIAAAPELLEACHDALLSMGAHGPCQNNDCSDCAARWKRINAAISKATAP